MSDNDDELCIPRSAMYKLVKELVPQVRLSSEAKELIVTACNEFIHLLASEANTVCEKQSKKLILPDHVLLALDNLGFGEYKDDCVEVMKQMQEEVDKRRKLRNRLEKPGIPEEELLRRQNELFAQARIQQNESIDEWTRVQQEAQMQLRRQTSSATAAATTSAAASVASASAAAVGSFTTTQNSNSNYQHHNHLNNNHNNNQNLFNYSNQQQQQQLAAAAASNGSGFQLNSSSPFYSSSFSSNSTTNVINGNNNINNNIISTNNYNNNNNNNNNILNNKKSKHDDDDDDNYD